MCYRDRIDGKIIKTIYLGEDMNEKLHGLTIIDLISEKHIVLRRAFEERWADTEEEEITRTEGLLLAKIKMGRISLAEVARQVNVSRQAIFKCAKKLEERGYLVFKVDEDGSKYTQLTQKGISYCERSRQLKVKMEQEIISVIGEDATVKLKRLLEEQWLIEE